MKIWYNFRFLILKFDDEVINYITFSSPGSALYSLCFHILFYFYFIFASTLIFLYFHINIFQFYLFFSHFYFILCYFIFFFIFTPLFLFVSFLFYSFFFFVDTPPSIQKKLSEAVEKFLENIDEIPYEPQGEIYGNEKPKFIDIGSLSHEVMEELKVSY